MRELRLKRRSLLQSVSMLAVGGTALLKTGNLQAAVEEATQSVESWPSMAYRKLGKTDFNGSRLVFGCGAALSNGQANHLLEPAFESGINVFDVGYSSYYRDAEKNLSPFLSSHRDEIFLISKAPAGDIKSSQTVNVAQARQAAAVWTRFMEGSLRELKVEHVDAYYLMGSNNAELVRSEEIYSAFAKAKEAGKVSHLGLSTHENAEKVLLSAAETGWYSLAQIAITPEGWYDWGTKKTVVGSPDMTSLRPVLDKARDAGIGLIGMKAGRYLAGRRFAGWGAPDAFDRYYSENAMQAKLTAFQRSYAYVLANGLDAVNADMQQWQHMKENFAAATSAQQYFV
jgi:aryl-alcohol dehydrogenase-like predicted oxidoreductase